VTVLVALGGAAFLAAVAWKGPVELRLLFLFVFLVFASGLTRPPTAGGFSAFSYWDALAVPSAGNRYLIGPVFLMLCAIVWVTFANGLPARVLGGLALAAALAFGVRLDWREPPLRDYDFEQYVGKYERAAPGERIQVITPPGWSFVLTKR
jgi:hypothetical protein